ncbi:hypothetical protein [Variovorax sp. GT1P44]|uniref:hypothetical protein n=1 Tax=Variovorax sp. GT1P44 TaxID=3443742 RepID=UPI003F4792A5
MNHPTDMSFDVIHLIDRNEPDERAIMAVRRDDLDALLAANHSAGERLQAMVRQQRELLGEALQRMKESGLCAEGDRESTDELARRLWNEASIELKAYTERAFCAQIDAMVVIGKRAGERIFEIRNLIKAHRLHAHD